MATHTISDDLITSPQAEEYFTRADRRVMIGLRATLELLGLPLPDYAQRKPAGPNFQSAKGVAARYAADNPGSPTLHTNLRAALQQPDERRRAAALAKARARIAARQAR